MKEEKTQPMKPTPQQVSRAGEHFVVAEIFKRGGFPILLPDGTADFDIVATDARQTRTVRIQVKTRRSGSWQTSITKGRTLKKRRNETAFWIFVDLTKSSPFFYIVPDWWIRTNIHEVHQAALKRQGGTRPNNPASKHHGIRLNRIEEWKDRWELLGIF